MKQLNYKIFSFDKKMAPYLYMGEQNKRKASFVIASCNIDRYNIFFERVGILKYNGKLTE